MQRCASGAPLRRGGLACRSSAPRPLAALATLAALGRLPAWAALAAALTFTTALPPFAPKAQAQDARPMGHRPFPATALRGELIVTAWPEALLNGAPARLAPGARLRGEDNLLRPPASLTGQTLLVHYTREAASGLVMDVWVLNPVERDNRPWPATEAEARIWSFDAVTQKWTRR